MRRSTIAIGVVVALVLILALVVWARGRNGEPAVATIQFHRPKGRSALPAAAAFPADDGNWTLPAKAYAATRFSALNQVNGRNVGRLRLAFTFDTGADEGFEAPPLVVGSMMYVVGPWPTKVFALDLTKPNGPPKWVYDPRPARPAR